MSNNEEDLKTLIADLSDGNPGALTVMCSLVQHFGAPMTNLVLNMVKDHGIRGSTIWVIYKDECGEDLERTIAALIKPSQRNHDTKI